MFTVSNAGNTNYKFKTEVAAMELFDSLKGGHTPLWVFKDYPHKQVAEYLPQQ